MPNMSLSYSYELDNVLENEPDDNVLDELLIGWKIYFKNNA
jgi:hypothetical protein